MMKYDITSATNRPGRFALLSALVIMPLLLTGCGLKNPGSVPQPVSLAGMQGTVFGGQLPIQNANIYLYAAGTTGYASTNQNILTAGVQTGLDGTFSITNDYNCTAGQQMYIVGVGGDTGDGTNLNQVTAAALGDCSTLGPSTFIQMNEVTTVAAAFALAPFATGYAAIGSDAGNTSGLVRAFVNASKIANVATGTANGTLPASAIAPTAEVYALADILSSCVNSEGGTAGDTTDCGKLFTYTTPPGGTAPTDVFGAAINIAKYPTNNVGALFNRIPAQVPFATALSSPPNDWTISIVYKGSFNAPTSTTVDGNGQVWVANSGNNTISTLAQNGTPVLGSPFSGNGLNIPVAIAVAGSGNVSVANKGASTVSSFTNAGGVVLGSPFLVGNAPDALAYDAAGNLWVANSSGNSVTELNSSGTPQQTVTSNLTSPGSVVIDPK
jgi:DNA-binding beta-propeller fold protein YncE